MKRYEHCGKCGKPVIIGGHAPSGMKHLRGLHDHVVTTVKLSAAELTRLRREIAAMSSANELPCEVTEPA